MNRILAITGAALIALLQATAVPAQTPQGLGVWLTQSGNLEVNIAPCGQALCGTVVRVLGNRSMSQPGREMKAADARSALGMQILTEFMPAGDNSWQGRIYNRENGKTYDCRMTRIAPDRLEIRAYKFLPLFGQTQVWTRVQDERKS